MTVNRRWFGIQAQGDSAEITLFSEVGGFGVSVQDFKRELDRVKGSSSILLSINSAGGSAIDGMAIYALLAELRDKLTVKVLGLAASIASIIALAGKSLIMGEGSFFMIHQPWCSTTGTAADLQKTSRLLDSIAGQMADIYASRSRTDKKKIVSMMREETWLTCEEAVRFGFASSVDRASSAVAALVDISKFGFQHAPREVLARAVKEKNPPATLRDLERLLRDAGYSRSTAAGITSRGFSAVRGAGGSGGKGSGEPRELAGSSVSQEPVSAERAAKTRQRMRLLLATQNT